MPSWFAKNSPYKTINDLVAAWKANPKRMAVGGGSSPGGPDHLLPMQLAQTVGIDPKEVNFVSYDGGGDLLPAILGGKVTFAASGFGEFLDQVEAGEVRVLAISGAERVDRCGCPDPEGVRHRPGVHQLAGRRRAAGALRRRQGGPGQCRGQDARKSGVEGGADQERLDRRLPDRGEFGTYMAEQTKGVEDVLTKLGLA